MKKNAGFRGGITKTVEALRPERPENDLAVRHVPLSHNGELVNNTGARYNIEVEFPDGSRAEYLNVDERTKSNLASQGVVTPVEVWWAYSLRIQEGDLVRLPDGRLGTVRMVEDKVDGHEKIVSVDVDGVPRRWFGLRAPLPMRFADGEINYLKFVVTKEEMEVVSTELDEELNL